MTMGIAKIIGILLIAAGALGIGRAPAGRVQKQMRR
jgi:hypothetical protein